MHLSFRVSPEGFLHVWGSTTSQAPSEVPVEADLSIVCGGGLNTPPSLHDHAAFPVSPVAWLTAPSTSAVHSYTCELIALYLFHEQDTGPVGDFLRLQTCQFKFCPGGLHIGKRKSSSASLCVTSCGGLRLVTCDLQRPTGTL